MSGRHTYHMQSRFVGKISGRHYETAEEMQWHERQEAMKRGLPTTDFEKTMENASADEIRIAFEKLSRSEQERADLAAMQADLLVFFEMHPEYSDSPHNAAIMKHHLHTLGIKFPTVEQFEEALEACKASGLLELNQVAVAKQKRDATLRRAEAIRELRNNEPTEDEMYSMSLDELRQRADGVWNGHVRR